jgi:hypothetical protein
MADYENSLRAIAKFRSAQPQRLGAVSRAALGVALDCGSSNCERSTASKKISYNVRSSWPYGEKTEALSPQLYFTNISTKRSHAFKNAGLMAREGAAHRKKSRLFQFAKRLIEVSFGVGLSDSVARRFATTGASSKTFFPVLGS